MGGLVPTACDAPEIATLRGRRRVDGTWTYECLCIVCARCGHHTGNGTQGHYWAYCKVAREIGPLHFCCPGNCELRAGADAAV